MSASAENHDPSHAHGHDHGPPPPPEPKTPMWLTAVGAVLFLLVGLIWGLSGPGAEGEGKSAAPAGSAAPAAH